MFLKRRAGELKRYDDAIGNLMVESLRFSTSSYEQTFDKLTEPPRPDFRRWIDEELVTLIARKPDAAVARLAASEMRRREAWQTPSKWALFVSLLSLAISAAAFIRTFNG